MENSISEESVQNTRKQKKEKEPMHKKKKKSLLKL